MRVLRIKTKSQRTLKPDIPVAFAVDTTVSVRVPAVHAGHHHCCHCPVNQSSETRGGNTVIKPVAMAIERVLCFSNGHLDTVELHTKFTPLADLCRRGKFPPCAVSKFSSQMTNAMNIALSFTFSSAHTCTQLNCATPKKFSVSVCVSLSPSTSAV